MPALENKFLISTSISYNELTITQVKIVSTESGTSATAGIRYYISADGGLNYDEISNNTLTTLVNSGTDLMYIIEFWRNDGVSNPKITELQIEYY